MKQLNDLYKRIFQASKILIVLVSILSVHSTIVLAQEFENELTIEIEQIGLEDKLAAWVWIQTDADDNFGGWYEQRNLKGFPAFSPIKINVPAGLTSITAWNSDCDEVSTQILIAEDRPANCKLTLIPRFDLHKSGYFSFDGHNHLDGENTRNCPPYIYPYCAALGIDHLDVCQLWFHEEDKPVSYDSIVAFLKEKTTPELSMNFACESPKLRYGHTWFINHPGLKNPFGDYLNWHDVDYYNFVNSNHAEKSGSIDLRGELHPKWNPPFVDRLRNKARGSFSVAAHPTRWWHQSVDEIFPATNTAADLAFDLIAAQSYDGLVVMGDCKDNIFYQNLWFNILNLGYRLTPVAETDGNIANGSLGKLALTHTWTGKNKFDIQSLTENLLAGHTMISGKAVMLLIVDGIYPPGTVLTSDGEKHTIDVKVYSEPAVDEYVSFLILYRNGKVLEKLDFREQKKRFIEHQFVVNDTETAWYVIKSYGKVFPKNDLQFDVLAYAEKCLLNPDNDYTKNTGVSIAAPVYFNTSDWQSPKPLISKIYVKVLDNYGDPLKKTLVEIWNIDEKLAEITTDNMGNFEIDAPATIDVRFTLPTGQKEQQWLFYEYPPLLDLIEDTYTISWAKTYPGILSGQMPWEAFHYNKTREVLETVHWTIIPNGKKMLSE